MTGRAVERFRAPIRDVLGFRVFSRGDEDKMISWLAEARAAGRGSQPHGPRPVRHVDPRPVVRPGEDRNRRTADLLESRPLLRPVVRPGEDRNNEYGTQFRKLGLDEVIRLPGRIDPLRIYNTPTGIRPSPLLITGGRAPHARRSCTDGSARSSDTKPWHPCNM
jgi:hypothetical protein